MRQHHPSEQPLRRLRSPSGGRAKRSLARIKNKLQCAPVSAAVPTGRSPRRWALSRRGRPTCCAGAQHSGQTLGHGCLLRHRRTRAAARDRPCIALPQCRSRGNDHTESCSRSWYSCAPRSHVPADLQTASWTTGATVSSGGRGTAGLAAVDPRTSRDPRRTHAQQTRAQSRQQSGSGSTHADCTCP